MAASEKIIKRMYYITTICFLLFTTVMVMGSESNNELYGDLATFFLLLEYLICVILMILYLCLLFKQIDQINHLNFITEKKVLYNTSITFVVVMATRFVAKTILIFEPQFLVDLGLFPTIMYEVAATLLFEQATLPLSKHLILRTSNHTV